MVVYTCLICKEQVDSEQISIYIRGRRMRRGICGKDTCLVKLDIYLERKGDWFDLIDKTKEEIDLFTL